jgi:hypothetical protein
MSFRGDAKHRTRNLEISGSDRPGMTVYQPHPAAMPPSTVKITPDV